MSKNTAKRTSKQIAAANQAIADLPMTYPIVANSTYVDRLGGQVTTEPAWRATPNTALMARRLISQTVRDDVAAFFTSHALVDIIAGLIPVRTLSLGTVAISVTDLSMAISEKVRTPEAMMVAMELVVPFLIKTGVISERALNFSTRVEYHDSEVTVRKLATDVAVQQVLQGYHLISTPSIADRKYTPQAFGQEVSSLLAPLGLAFTDVNKLDTVIDDIVLAVRARIDPSLAGMNGSLPTTWRDHAAIQDFATNLVFIKAAMALQPGTNMTTANGEYHLDTYAPLILTKLKTSDRYAMVGAREIRSFYGLRKVRNVRREPVEAILYENMKMAPVAQAAYIFADARMKGASIVASARDRAAEALSAVYDSLDKVDTSYHVEHVCAIRQHLAEAAPETQPCKVRQYLGRYSSSIPAADIAALLATSIRVAFASDDTAVHSKDADGNDQVTYNVGFEYQVQTAENHIPGLTTGRHAGDMVYTTDPTEVFMAVTEFDPATARAPVAQVIEGDRMGESIVGLDADEFVSCGMRSSYSFNLDGISASGKLRAIDFGRLSSNSQLKFKIPMGNVEVQSQLDAIYMDVFDDIAEAAAQGMVEANTAMFLRLALNRAVMNLANRVAPGFRDECQSFIIGQSASGMSRADASRVRAVMTQATITAICDLITYDFFLRAQGIHSMLMEHILDAATNDELGMIVLEGSQRKVRPAI